MNGLSLTNDIVFKLVFGAEKRERILRALLNAVLGLKGPDRIVKLTIINPTLDKAHALAKNCILDIKARDGRGRRFNVEVQVSRDPNYLNRSLYYLTSLFSEQLQPGDGYDEITKVVSLSFVDYTLFPDQESLHSTYRLYDEENKRHFPDILELHYIELSKFKKDKPQDLRSRFERWLHILKFGELYRDQNSPIPAKLIQDKEVVMALKTYRQVSSSQEVRELLLSREMAERDRITSLKRAYKEGELKGELKGKLEAAQAMLSLGIDQATVCEKLGLKPEDLSR
ncbi:MAG: PD-(D/E)XK nuclease family transposase [Candidatus Eremiobacteraeota bacterium]|nr:PD-(D/E)XK nuclease family transposase [Candidatus Eremiobacteraeota bacterium]